MMLHQAASTVILAGNLPCAMAHLMAHPMAHDGAFHGALHGAVMAQMASKNPGGGPGCDLRHEPGVYSGVHGVIRPQPDPGPEPFHGALHGAVMAQILMQGMAQ